MEQPEKEPGGGLLSRVKRWDVAAFRRVNGNGSPWLRWLRHYTHVGYLNTWTSIIVITAVLSWLTSNPAGWLFAKLAIANFGSLGIILVFKVKINRIRPCHVLEGVTIRTSPHFFKGPSFPSGHVQFFFSNMLIVTLATATVFPGSPAALVPLAIALTAILAVSRVYVGVHYPTDVMAAFLSGLIIFVMTALIVYPFAFRYLYALIGLIVHA